MSRLLVILDDAKQDPEFVLREACAAGARLFLWRARHLTPRSYYDSARSLARIAATWGAKLLTHERLDVALAIAADGAHLPGDGLPEEAARAVLGQDLLLGKSIHHPEELESARLRSQLSYVTASPVYSPTSKPDDDRATLGPEGLAALVDAAQGLPVFALGGITPERVAASLDAGAHGVAVLGGISHAADPYAATRSYLEALDQE